MEKDLDSILSGGKSETETTEIETEEAPAEEVENQEEVQEEDPKQGGEEPEETPASDEKKEEKWTKKAAIAERKKRQDLEKLLQDKEKELQAFKQPKAQEEKAQRPDVLDDQEGAFSHSENKLNAALWNQKVSLTQDLMREKHDDFDAVTQRFLKQAFEDKERGGSAMLNEYWNSPNPAKFAYESAKKLLKMDEVSAPDYEQNVEKKLREKILAEIGKKSDEEDEELTDSEDPKPVKKPIKLPPSFANATSAKSGDKFVEEKSLDEIFPPINKR